MSSPSIHYYVVDVFSSIPYKGNPLAIVDNTATTLTTTQMQLITRQFNLSETTFICSPQPSTGATWRLRSFLPNGVEVFGAGHNSLGAWWWLAYSGRCAPGAPGLYTQQLGTDILPVRISKSSSPKDEIAVSMQQGKFEQLDVHPDPSSLAAALGISVEDISLQASLVGRNTTVNVDKPLVATTSAARHLLVPVKNRDVLYEVVFTNTQLIERELARTGSQGSGVYVYTIVDQGTCGVPKLEARFFSPGMGMEDPATGSAAGPLVAYLSRATSGNGAARKIRDEERFEVVQGLKVGRECVMNIGVSEEGVTISGTGVLVATGMIAVPSSEIALD